MTIIEMFNMFLLDNTKPVIVQYRLIMLANRCIIEAIEYILFYISVCVRVCACVYIYFM